MNLESKQSNNLLNVILMDICFLFYLLTIINSFNNLHITIILQPFLPSYSHQFTINFMDSLKNIFDILPVFWFVMTRFRVKLSVILFWGFRSIFTLFCFFTILAMYLFFHLFIRDLVDLVYLFLEIFEEAIET